MGAVNPENAADGAPKRCGMFAVVGRANVGKSSLLNALLGEKVSIVSPVEQTTRNTIRGILTEARGQLVFMDTPGVHKATGELGTLMNKMARRAAEGADAVMLVLDASEAPRDEDIGWISRLLFHDAPCVICLNKCDLSPSRESAYREAWRAKEAEKGASREAVWLKTSATTGQGVPELLERLFAMSPEGPLLFPEDVLTDYPRKLNIADVIREKIFAGLRDEVPHAVAVEVQDIAEGEDGWNVSATIYVNKASQKGILLGEKGRRLRKVKRSSEAELTAMYGTPVTVSLWIKVEKNWSRNFWLLKKLGYVT